MIESGIEQSTQSTGTGDIILIVPPAGRRSFAAAIAPGHDFLYRIEQDDSGKNWEEGVGRIISVSPDVMTRTVVRSSNSNNPLDLLSGVTKRVYCAEAADTIRFGATGELLTAAGTAAALTLAYTPVLRQLSPGMVFMFVAAADAVADATLGINGKGAKPIVRSDGTAIANGEWLAAQLVYVVYENVSGGRFRRIGSAGLQDGAVTTPKLAAKAVTDDKVADGLGVPIGACLPYMGGTVPANFKFPVGANLSRTAYPKLFEAYGTLHGTGDGSTTFGTPDGRGRVLVGADDMGGVAAGRITTATMSKVSVGGVGGLEAQVQTSDQMSKHVHNMPRSTTNWGGGGGSNNVSTYALAAYDMPTAEAGNNAPQNNMQPSLVCNYIMRVA